MQIQKSNTLHSNSRELEIIGDRYFISGTDVTPLVKKSSDTFLSVMGRASNKSFHNYYGLDNGVWKKFTGVTSVLECVGDKSNLMQWYADQVVSQFGWSKQLKTESASQYLERLTNEMSPILDSFVTLSREEQVDFIKKCRTAATSFARKSANLGRDVHEKIEMYIKDCLKDNRGAAKQITADNEQVQHFIDWAVKNNVKFRASEYVVCNKTYWYAGTCDLILEIGEDLFVGDIKTTNYIFGRSYFAQCAAYRLALEEMFGDKYSFSGSIIIRIGRDGLFNPEEDVHLSPYYEDDKRYFLAGLEVYRQERNMFTNY